MNYYYDFTFPIIKEEIYELYNIYLWLKLIQLQIKNRTSIFVRPKVELMKKRKKNWYKIQ